MVTASVNSNNGTLEQSYTYDYLGNRTSKTTDGVTTYYVTDLSSGYSQVLKATTGSDVIYYTRGFELISRNEGTEASYYLYDGGMSVRGITDEAGTLTDTYVFDAFGNEVARTGTTENSYGYRGEEQDETGLYYLRARYMDPSTGTFTTMDTYGGRLSDPMSLHKYMYANSNPVKYCDPSGHFSALEFAVAGAIMATLSYGLTYLVACAIDRSQGTNYSDKFSWQGLIVAVIVGAALGFLGYCFLLYFLALELSFIQYVGLGILCFATGLDLKYISNQTNNAFANAIISTLGDVFIVAGYSAWGAAGTVGVNSLENNSEHNGTIREGGQERGRGWHVGDPIDNLTARGNNPAWSTVRRRYWLNEAYLNPELYSESNLQRMQRGLAPIDAETGASMELHHVAGRNALNANNENNIVAVWPWEHDYIDPYRHYTGPVPIDW